LDSAELKKQRNYFLCCICESHVFMGVAILFKDGAGEGPDPCLLSQKHGSGYMCWDLVPRMIPDPVRGF
jgi:hypothetical protein